MCITDAHIWLRLTEKTKRGWAYRRVVRLPMAARSHRGVSSALPVLAQLGRLYLEARTALAPPRQAAAVQWVFQLPGERYPVVWCMSTWVQTVMRASGASKLCAALHSKANRCAAAGRSRWASGPVLWSRGCEGRRARGNPRWLLRVGATKRTPGALLGPRRARAEGGRGETCGGWCGSSFLPACWHAVW